MAHYFTNDIVKDAPEEITIHFRDFTYKLNSNAGVFSKDKLDEGTRILLETVLDNATEPENIIVLSDLQINNLLTNIPFSVFKREIDKLSETQVREIANYAILHEIADIQKTDYIGELTGVDILKAISRNKDVKKAEAKMNQSENK